MKLFVLIIIIASVSETIAFHFFRNFFGKPLKHLKNKRLFKNIVAVSIPILGLMALLAQRKFSYVVLFFFFAVIGTILEYLLGKFLHLVEGRRVWVYQYLAIGQYTSWLSLPYWGGVRPTLYLPLQNNYLKTSFRPKGRIFML